MQRKIGQILGITFICPAKNITFQAKHKSKMLTYEAKFTFFGKSKLTGQKHCPQKTTVFDKAYFSFFFLIPCGF